MPIEYITTRELENSKGELKGKVRILKMAEEPKAKVEFTCPECGAADSRMEEWKEPFTEGSGKTQKFILFCRRCEFKTKILKLKKEAKKK